ncbi:hypothetical protein C8039_08495 [Halogeometricum sp. wsp3]|nr:hypothetical protein C8039_08495 [Halogeometricum sp. wsp3]
MVRSPLDGGRSRIHTNHAGRVTSNDGVTNTTVRRGVGTYSRNNRRRSTRAATSEPSRAATYVRIPVKSAGRNTAATRIVTRSSNVNSDPSGGRSGAG